MEKYIIIYNDKKVLDVIAYLPGTHIAMPSGVEQITTTIVNAKLMLAALNVDYSLLDKYSSAKQQ